MIKIKLTGGPVGIVTSSESVILSYGKNGEMLSISAPSEVYACTCGKSSKYPLCDGSHNQPVIDQTSEYPLLS